MTYTVVNGSRNARIGHDFSERLTDLLKIFPMHPTRLKNALADLLFRIVTQYPSNRRTLIEDGAMRVQHSDDIVGVVQKGAEALFILFKCVLGVLASGEIPRRTIEEIFSV